MSAGSFLVGFLAFFVVLFLSVPARGAGEHRIYLPLFVLPDVFTVTPSEIEFNLVTSITHAGDDRLFVVSRGGVINVVQPTGGVSQYLNLLDEVIWEGGSEQGMFDMVFHPNYANNGYFYVSYTGSWWGGDDRWLLVDRYQVSDDDPNVADKDSRVSILRVQQEFNIHNGGGLGFWDGHLYVGVGDDLQSLIAQDSDSVKGKIIRIEDGLSKAPTRQVAWLDAMVLGNSEIWAMGFRNPWRFDIVQETGVIFVGDVGDNKWEEVDVIAGQGLNFGWPCVEGPEILFDSGDCRNPEGRFVWPIHHYRHGEAGCAVIGGKLYSGPWPDERFIFGDACNRDVFVIYNIGGGEWVVETLGRITGADGLLTTFGLDNNGNLYAGTLAFPGPYFKIHIPAQ